MTAESSQPETIPQPVAEVTLELRVHSGLHQGACQPLAQGDYVLGSGHDCDFILTDADVQPQHARLTVGTGGAISLLWLTDEEPAATDQPLTLGHLTALGSLVFSVADASSPWPQDAAVQRVASQWRSAQQAESITQAESTAKATAESAPSVPAATQEHSATVTDDPWDKPDPLRVRPPTPGLTPAPEPAQSLLRRYPLQTLAAALVVVVFVAGGITWLTGGDSAPASTAVQAPRSAASGAATPSAIAMAQREAIGAILQKLKLSDRAQVLPAAGDQWVVRTLELEINDLEALAQALSNLQPRPGLRTLSTQEVSAQLQEVLARWSSTSSAQVRLVEINPTQFRVEGTVANDTERQALMKALQIPLNTLSAGISPVPWQVQDGLALAPEAAMQLLVQLQAQGPPGQQVSGQWRDGQLWLQARLAQSDIPRWEQTLARLFTRYPVPFSAQVEPLTASSALTTATTKTLPFAVQAVISGQTPYVVLQDGTKLLLAGQRQGWTLVGIDPQQVIFESKAAQRVRLMR